MFKLLEHLRYLNIHVFISFQITMSWDAHVKSLMAGPEMRMAGLFGQDGHPWAKSGGFNPSQAEVLHLVKLVNGDYSGESITVNGVKYMFRSPADDGMITILSLGTEEKFACTACETGRGLIIGVALASTAGASREYLDKYKNYLKGIGY